MLKGEAQLMPSELQKFKSGGSLTKNPAGILAAVSSKHQIAKSQGKTPT
jgi:hypothetical protein